MSTTITIKNLTKRFGDVAAVNNVSLTIEPGTFLTLLGPSGCGKTTLLRCIAGLEDPNEGEIYIGDKLVFSSVKGVSLPPGQRDLGLVFQNYALWPHMKVDKNLTFALEVRKMPKEEMQKRVKDALAEVQMEGYEDRYPREMSGGQQQRVAVARAIINNPTVVLADEPTANLDTENGSNLLAMMRKMNREKNITFIFSSHDKQVIDQAERLLILKDGMIEE